MDFAQVDRVLAWADAGPFHIFVETGTHLGETANLMSLRYRVVTIEKSPELAARARERFRDGRVDVIEGASEDRLGEVLGRIRAPCIVYLDAHWYVDVQPVAEGECPLLKEIDVLAARPYRDLVIIDDAQLLGTQAPHYGDWTHITRAVVEAAYGPCRSEMFDNKLAIVRA